MKIALITPGTGSYYCGVCMRDNALARELRRLGHNAVLIPMYLPLQLDEAPAPSASPIFFGGISTFLREKSALFRRMPRWLDRVLSQEWLLKLVAGRAAKTGGPDVAEMTISMLRGEQGNQLGEINALVNWLRVAFDGGAPDVIWLSTALQAGLARNLSEQLQIPVLGFLQGEDSFLDGLGPEYSPQVWALLSERMKDAALWVAPSRYFAELMAQRLQWDPDLAARSIQVVWNGISTEGYAVVDGDQLNSEIPIIGYLARLIPAKGLGLLVEAFIQLRKRGRVPAVQLHCAGSMIGSDGAYVETLKTRIRSAGLESQVMWFPNVSRTEKIAFLKSLTVFSVPAPYSEAFGLYVIEAMAAGVPVVQPRSAAFPEIIDATCGGLMFEPLATETESALRLSEALEELLLNPARIRELGFAGRNAVKRDFTIESMALKLAELGSQMCSRTESAKVSAGS